VGPEILRFGFEADVACGGLGLAVDGHHMGIGPHADPDYAWLAQVGKAADTCDLDVERRHLGVGIVEPGAQRIDLARVDVSEEAQGDVGILGLHPRHACGACPQAFAQGGDGASHGRFQFEGQERAH
jgi:hypothetical protein